MAKLKWDQLGDKTYETGVSKGILFPYNSAQKKYDKGVAWNGLISVSESPEGGEANPFYADNIKYLNLMSLEEYKGSISAYTYPEEFEACDGSVELAPGVKIGQQTRKMFALCYRTEYGNDTEGNDYGYKLHLIYGCQATPSQKEYSTINDNPEPIEFSWDIDTTPIEVPGYKVTASITIDSKKCDPLALKDLEDKLYGTETKESTLPLPEDLVGIFKIREITSLTQKTAPTKTAYNVGDNFDPTGFVATATFDDSTTKDIEASLMTYEPMVLDSDTIVEVVASYKHREVTKTVNITVTVTAG